MQAYKQTKKLIECYYLSFFHQKFKLSNLIVAIALSSNEFKALEKR